MLITKIELYFSCDVEDSVDNHLCRLCVIPRMRARRGVYVLMKAKGLRLPLVLLVYNSFVVHGGCFHQKKRDRSGLQLSDFVSLSENDKVSMWRMVV